MADPKTPTTASEKPKTPTTAPEKPKTPRKPAFRMNDRQRKIVVSAVGKFKAEYAEKYANDTDNPLLNHAEVMADIDAIIKQYS